MAETIKALNWKNPYAAAMLIGKIETRTWNTNYRGKVLICTSKVSYSAPICADISDYLLVDMMKKIRASKHSAQALMNNGYAVAIATLVNSRPMNKLDEPFAYVKYDSQRLLYCHVYKDVMPIIPIPWKGSQKWKNVSEEVINQIQIIKP